VVNQYDVTYAGGKLLFDKEGYNRNGYGMKMVSDFVSDLSVLQDGKEVERKKIEVNSPLEHKEFTFYQTNSTMLSESDLKAIGEKIFDKAKIDIHIDGKHLEVTARYRELTQIDGTEFSILMEDFDCNFVQIYGPNEKPYMRDQQITLAVVKDREVVGRYQIYLDPAMGSEILKKADRVDSISLLELEPFYKTGIEIATSPGSSMVWLGFLFSSIGLVFTFYLNYRQIFIAKFKDKKGRDSIALAVNSKFDNERILEDIKTQVGGK
jgi:cytochrome c biogenesis protein